MTDAGGSHAGGDRHGRTANICYFTGATGIRFVTVVRSRSYKLLDADALPVSPRPGTF